LLDFSRQLGKLMIEPSPALNRECPILRLASSRRTRFDGGIIDRDQ
jgi:hypothetical protein